MLLRSLLFCEDFNFMQPFQLIRKAFFNLVYPPLCLYCKETVQTEEHLLCFSCLTLLQLIDPSERCPYCFSSQFCIEKRLCPECIRKPPILNGIAGAFDYAGPAACLIRKLKYADLPYLANGCGAYLAAQFLQLGWPMPDLLIPVPIATTHWIERGYNQSLLLAQSLSKILNRPVQEALIRKSGDYSQAGLSRQQRLELESNLFFLKKSQQLADKNILLIDDVMTTGSTLRKCAEILQEECPSTIYGLTVCRAIK